ncbi:MAG TPA: hypothetical protein VJS44_05895 [Pyrinomonadaceae bacterium]|nr:hypothetical protein [Pyrinomonadaceae bacterium]
MLLRTLLFLSLVMTCAHVAQAQSRPTVNDSVNAAQSKPGGSDRGPDLGTPEEEMRARNEIKIAEKERQENLERAKEVAQLGAEIRDGFTKSQSIGAIEIKKLERLEKLARRIRSRAGGSDDDEPLDNVPASLAPAVSRLADTSEALFKGVEKTPRMVISTVVIERANELLEIIRFIRTNSR